MHETFDEDFRRRKLSTTKKRLSLRRASIGLIQLVTSA
jgi:hypothetical protein